VAILLLSKRFEKSKFSCALFLQVVLCAIGFAKPENRPNYLCNGPEKKILTIRYLGNQAEVHETDPRDPRPKKWLLSKMLNLSDPPRKPVRIYLNPPQDAAVAAASFFEIQEQYDLGNRDAQIKLWIFKEGQPLSSWTCAPTGFAARIKLADEILDFIPPERLWMSQIPKGFVTEDSVSGDSIFRLKYSLSKYSVWKAGLDAPTFKRMINESCRSLLFLAPQSIKGIEDQLNEVEKKMWLEVLNLIDYQGASPLPRWLFWVELLKENNKEAFRSAIREFSNSSLAKDRNTRNLFVKEARNQLSSASVSTKKQIRGEEWDTQQRELIEELTK